MSGAKTFAKDIRHIANAVIESGSVLVTGKRVRHYVRSVDV